MLMAEHVEQPFHRTDRGTHHKPDRSDEHDFVTAEARSQR
jgi:hypothetical protein